MDDLSYGAALVARVLVGAVLIWAGLAKVRKPDEFARSLRAYEFVPARLQAALAMALPPIEIALGVAFILGFEPWVVGFAIAAMLATFAMVSVAMFGWQGQASCGCFGGDAETSVKSLVLRNGALTVLALAGATTSWSLSPVLGAVVIVVALAGLVALLPSLASALASEDEGEVSDPQRRRLIRVASLAAGAGGLLALTKGTRGAEAACSSCGSCASTYTFIACAGGGCAAYWVRTRTWCSTGCNTCGTWSIQEFCGIPGC